MRNVLLFSYRPPDSKLHDAFVGNLFVKGGGTLKNVTELCNAGMHHKKGEATREIKGNFATVLQVLLYTLV